MKFSATFVNVWNLQVQIQINQRLRFSYKWQNFYRKCFQSSDFKLIFGGPKLCKFHLGETEKIEDVPHLKENEKLCLMFWYFNNNACNFHDILYKNNAVNLLQWLALFGGEGENKKNMKTLFMHYTYEVLFY